ncbi:MAG: site-2 protease family protein [Pyrinomonadaceae bacterium]
MAKLSHRALQRQIQVAKIFAIPVRIDYRWFAIFILTAWVIASNILQGFFGIYNVGVATAWALSLVAAIMLFLSVFGHELAHALVARAEGIEIDEILLHPFGGLARLRHEPESPGAEFRIAIAGPAASFFFAICCFIAANLIASTGFYLGAAVVSMVAIGNFLLAVFNLFPGYPLDGGRVLRAALWWYTGQLANATRISVVGGKLIAWMLIVFGISIACLTLIGGHGWSALLMGVWSVVVGLFLLDAARAIASGMGPDKSRDTKSMAGLHTRISQSGEATLADAMGAPFAIEPEMTINHLVNVVLPTRKQTIFLVAENKRLHGLLSLEDIKTLPRVTWSHTKAREVMRPVEPDYFATSETLLVEAEVQMKRNGVGVLAVINRSGELIGFLERKK